MLSVAVIILTYNEELHLERCIRSISELTNKIYIVDSYSTDRTVEIAKQFGCDIQKHIFVNQAKQFQWGLDNCSIDSKWIMRLDADEYLEPELAQEIKKRLPNLPEDVSGVMLTRKHIFMNRWIKHGTRYPLTMLRIWRRERGWVEQRWMDEHIVVKEGNVIKFKNNFCDHNLNDISSWIEKHNRYATREAIEIINKRYNLFDVDESLKDSKNISKVYIKRHIKEKFYNKLPTFLGPIFYFTYRYIFRLGFLDGKEGFIYHFLQGFWYRFLVGVKVLEFDITLSNFQSRSDRLSVLQKLTGFNFGSTNKD